MSTRAGTATLSIALMLWAGLAQSAMPQEPKKPREQMLKEQVIEMPTGAVVEVRFMDKQKLRGKLGSISDASFELQTVDKGEIKTHNLAYEQVRSIKYHEKGMSTAAKIVLGALAGVGAFLLIIIGIAAARGWD